MDFQSPEYSLKAHKTSNFLKPRLGAALLFCLVVVCPFYSCLVRWLGGSFAKLGFGLCMCGFANVPPNALAKY
jgi:hypothetical protein